MKFVWTNYHVHAFGADEIMPLNATPRSTWGNIGCMIIDSIDTLWIMDLKDEFEQARQWVHTELSFKHMGTVSVFETIIRSVGGLLSAYDLSKDPAFLAKAQELADLMIPAINKTTGRTYYYLDTLTNEAYKPGGLAASGTYQLEFEYLSRESGDPKYATLAAKLYPYLRSQPEIQRDGLFAKEIYSVDENLAESALTLRLGAGCDSFYEYLLKVWILKGQPASSVTKEMYVAAVEGMEHLLLGESVSGRLYVGEYDLATSTPHEKLEHLACFVPGMLALGADRLQSEDPKLSARHLSIAKRLMETCYKDLYEKQPTHLSPDYVEGPDLLPGEDPSYRLRPEVVESLYVLHQLTDDPMYQEWGWAIFEAIDRDCRTEWGFAQFKNVSQTVEWSTDTKTLKSQQQLALMNRMETFFTAETLKYLYLLFDDGNPYVNLRSHVFNTEAHPLTISRS